MDTEQDSIVDVAEENSGTAELNPGISKTENLESNTDESMVTDRAYKILSQNRSVMNFEHYQPSKQHVERMKQLATIAPDLYNNPSITKRPQWFTHKKWNQNSQMPPFHIHFREEMYQVIKYLVDGYHAVNKYINDAKARGDTSTSTKVLSSLHLATTTFQNSMMGLNGHVQIEEFACFPLYQSNFPKIDLLPLYHDHDELFQLEENIKTELRSLEDKMKTTLSTGKTDTSVPEAMRSQVVDGKKFLLGTLRLVLDFDEKLMTHLGEEEEIVVPMSLTDREILF